MLRKSQKDDSIIIKSTLLTLRNVNNLDADDLVELANDRDIAEMMNGSIPFPYIRKLAEEWIEKHLADNVNSQAISWIIEKNDNKKLIGSLQLRLDEKRKTARFSYWLGKPFWNKGYITEACRSVLKFAFNRLELEQVEAEVFERNPASKAVLLKLGFEFYESVEKEEKLDNKKEKFERYILLKQSYLKNIEYNGKI